MTSNPERVVIWRNGFRQVRYQPLLYDGRRLWRWFSWATTEKEWSRAAPRSGEPVLYRSQRWAERVAKRREHREYLKAWAEFGEASQ